jgi:hypothetical protein
MAAGDTTTQSLADSLPTVIASARQVREQEGVVPNLVDKVTLGEGTGLSWNEVSMAQLTAQTVTETTRLDNPQQMSDTLLTITPTVVGIHTLITDRVAARISKNAYARVGGLAQNAIQRKKDEDGLTAIDGASTTIGSSGSALTTGHIAAAVSRISSDADEPGNPPYRAVLHGFQIKDLYDAISLLSSGNPSGAPLTDGLAARVFQESSYRGVPRARRLAESLISVVVLPAYFSMTSTHTVNALPATGSMRSTPTQLHLPHNLMRPR